MPTTADKIFHDRDALAAWLAARRGDFPACRIVFTNGVFDLMHNGHLHSLRAARALGDVLIVAINDDASVRRLKGKARPILPVSERLRLLAALPEVDAVIAYGDDTPIPLLHLVKPDILAKGGQYTVEQVVGHEFVLERGGQVRSLPMLEGHSTTALLQRVRERLAS